VPEILLYISSPANNTIPNFDRRFFWRLVAIENVQEDWTCGQAYGLYTKSNEGSFVTSVPDPHPS